MDWLKEIIQRVEHHAEAVIGWRRQLHRWPELSHAEAKTSAFVVQELEKLGLTEIQTGVGGYGIVAEIDFGSPGGVIGIRADMDALPIQEQVVCDFASRNPGVMHACGHDAHTAMLLGAAQIFKELSACKQFSGKVRLIFQPGEERGDQDYKTGALRMIEEGALDGVAMMIGLHVTPTIDAGKLSFQRGCLTASADAFELIVHGAEAHAAAPHQGIDSIVIAAAIIQAAQHLVSRTISPTESGVVTIGEIHGGTAGNIIAGEVRMRGTVRTLNEAVRHRLLSGLAHLTKIAESMGGRAELRLQEGYPVGFNDPKLTDRAEETIRAAFGEHAIHPPDGPTMGADDFAQMSCRVPATFFRLGVKDPTWPAPLHAHTPTFQIDERALQFGTAALVAVALEALGTH